MVIKKQDYRIVRKREGETQLYRLLDIDFAAF